MESIAKMCPRSLDHKRHWREMLSVASCVLGQSFVQVVLLLWNRDFQRPQMHSQNAVEASNFGRALVAHLAMQYEAALADENEVVGRMVPHKREMVGGTMVFSCGSLREAMTFASTSAPDTPIMYAYLGGGVTVQPPHVSFSFQKHASTSCS